MNIKENLFSTILDTQSNIKTAQSEMIYKLNRMSNYVPKYTYCNYDPESICNEYFTTCQQIAITMNEQYQTIIDDYNQSNDNNGYVQEGVDDWQPITPIGWIIKAIIKAFKFVIDLIKSIFSKNDRTVANATESVDQICQSVLKPNTSVLHQNVKVVAATNKSAKVNSKGSVRKIPTLKSNAPSIKSVKVQSVKKSIKFRDQKTGQIKEKIVVFSPFFCNVEIKNKKVVYSIKGIKNDSMPMQAEVYGNIPDYRYKVMFAQILADLINTDSDSTLDKSSELINQINRNVQLMTNVFTKGQGIKGEFDKAFNDYVKLLDKSAKNQIAKHHEATNSVKFASTITSFTGEQLESATRKLNLLIKELENLDKAFVKFENKYNEKTWMTMVSPAERVEITSSIVGYNASVRGILDHMNNMSISYSIIMNQIAARMNFVWLASAEYEGTCDSLDKLADFVKKLIDAGTPSSFVGYNAWFVLKPALRGDTQTDSDNFIPKWGQTRIAFYPSNNVNSVIKVATNMLGEKATREEISVYETKLKNLNKAVTFHDYVHDKDRSQKINTLFTAPKSVFRDGVIAEFDRCKYTINNASNKNPKMWDSTAKNILNKIHGAGVLTNYYDIHKNNIGYNESEEWKVFDYAL